MKVLEKIKIDTENLESILSVTKELQSEIEVKVQQISELFEEEQT